jgi:tetratricopeptide (TPR) repeat protein
LSRRIETWEESWDLIRQRPWFAFTSSKPAPLQHLIGYGPETFRYTIRLTRDTPPPGAGRRATQVTHAHNYFIHQAAELGVLGFLTSLGIFVALFLVGGYLLLLKRHTLDSAYRLLLVGLLAVMAGRMLEQMVGVARVGDLTLFWALLAALAVLPVVFSPEPAAGDTASDPPLPPTGGRRRSRSRAAQPGHSDGNGPMYARLTIAVLVILVLGTVTWSQGINHPRAAVFAAQGRIQLQAGNLETARGNFDRAVSVASDVPTYYRLQSAVFRAYGEDAQTQSEPRCRIQSDQRGYEACLVKASYEALLQGVDQRYLDLFLRVDLAEVSLQLAEMLNIPAQNQATTLLNAELSQLWPRHWRLRDRAVVAYIKTGQPEQALEYLNQSLADTGTTGDWTEILAMAGEAQLHLGLYPEAIETFGEALVIRPTFTNAYMLRAQAWANSGEWELAIADYTEALALNPSLAKAYLNRGAAYADLGEMAQAARDASSALEQDPENAEAYSLRAVTLAILGRKQESREDVDRAVELGVERAVLEGQIQRLGSGSN